MHSYSMDLGGRTLTIEAGKIAKQANGAVLVRYGDTAVVVAVTGTKTPREGVDFFPLTVDFEEKMYAVGKINSQREKVNTLTRGFGAGNGNYYGGVAITY